MSDKYLYSVRHLSTAEAHATTTSHEEVRYALPNNQGLVDENKNEPSELHRPEEPAMMTTMDEPSSPNPSLEFALVGSALVAILAVLSCKRFRKKHHNAGRPHASLMNSHNQLLPSANSSTS